MKKIIHINQHIIKANRKNAANDPPITVKTYISNIKCHQAEWSGYSKLVYSPLAPLKCGARVWIETDCEVITS